MTDTIYPQYFGAPWLFTYPGRPMENVPTNPDNPAYLSAYNLWLDTTDPDRVDWWICVDGGDNQNNGLSWQFLFKQPAVSSYVDQSTLGFDNSRKPSETYNTFVTVSVKLENTAFTTSTVEVQISTDNINFSTIATLENFMQLVSELTYSTSFIVPANCYYKLVTSGGGSHTLVNLQELSF